MIEIAPESDTWLTYHEALLYCTFCEHNGYTDWRMPTFDEWANSTFNECVNKRLYGWYIGRDNSSYVTSSGSKQFRLRVNPVRDIPE